MRTVKLGAEAKMGMGSRIVKLVKEQPVSVLAKPTVENATVTWVIKKGLTEHQVPSVDIPSKVLASGPTTKAVYKPGIPSVFDRWEIEAEIKFPLSELPNLDYTAKYDFYVTENGTATLMDFEAALVDPGPYLVIDRNGDPPNQLRVYPPRRRHRLNASISAEGSGTPDHP